MYVGFGFLSATLGMDSCIDMASVYGIGMCSIKHSNHFGMSASFVLQAARRGMMSLVFTNSSPAVSPTRARGEFQFQSVVERGVKRRWTLKIKGTDFIPWGCFLASPQLPVWGGMSKLMGVSPIACGAPGNEQGEGSSGHFCLDMAPSVAARGKVYKALRRGEKIPTDWALDKEVSTLWRGDLSSMGGCFFDTDWISTGAIR
jgi:LDH2 family malate/lactate/ureidoglycolate dehydrogenase